MGNAGATDGLGKKARLAMNPVILGGIIVLLLIFVVVVTMGSTKWKRSELDAQSSALPGNKGRVSGEDD